MRRIATSTRAKDFHGPGKDGFTEGNPQLGTPPTELSADFFNMVQEELAAVVEGTGGALDEARSDQLLNSIRDLFALAALRNWSGYAVDDADGPIAVRGLAALDDESGCRWIACGERSTILRSYGGIEWQRDRVETLPHPDADLYGAAVDVTGRIVVSGTVYDGSTQGVVWWSELYGDDHTWHPGTLDVPLAGSLLDLAAGDSGVFVGVGAGAIYRSGNGKDFIRTFAEPGRWIIRVAFADGIWVALALDGVLSSPDGIEWTERSVFDGAALSWGPLGWIVASNIGETLRSTNGIDWSAGERIPASHGPVMAQTRDGVLVCGGRERDGIEANIRVLRPGGRWTKQFFRGQDEVLALAVGDGRIVASLYGYLAVTQRVVAT